MNFKEFDDLIPGQYIVIIEHCTNCKQHNQSLRHD